MSIVATALLFALIHSSAAYYGPTKVQHSVVTERDAQATSRSREIMGTMDITITTVGSWLQAPAVCVVGSAGRIESVWVIDAEVRASVMFLKHANLGLPTPRVEVILPDGSSYVGRASQASPEYRADLTHVVTATLSPGRTAAVITVSCSL